MNNENNLKWKRETSYEEYEQNGDLIREKHVESTASSGKWNFTIFHYGTKMFTLNAWRIIDTLPGLGKVDGRVDYTLHFTRLKAAKAAAEAISND